MFLFAAIRVLIQVLLLVEFSGFFGISVDRPNKWCAWFDRCAVCEDCWITFPKFISVRRFCIGWGFFSGFIDVLVCPHSDSGGGFFINWILNTSLDFSCYYLTTCAWFDGYADLGLIVSAFQKSDDVLSDSWFENAGLLTRVIFFFLRFLVRGDCSNQFSCITMSLLLEIMNSTVLWKWEI